MKLRMLGFLMVMTACGGSTNSGSGSNGTTSGTSSLAGSWTGRWESKSGVGGTATLSLTQSGNSVSGTTDLANSVCLVGAKVAGTIDGDDVNLDITAGDSHATAHVTIISATEIDGTYDAVSAGACTGDTGTLTATR